VITLLEFRWFCTREFECPVRTTAVAHAGCCLIFPPTISSYLTLRCVGTRASDVGGQLRLWRQRKLDNRAFPTRTSDDDGHRNMSQWTPSRVTRPWWENTSRQSSRDAPGMDSTCNSSLAAAAACPGCARRLTRVHVSTQHKSAAAVKAFSGMQMLDSASADLRDSAGPEFRIQKTGNATSVGTISQSPTMDHRMGRLIMCGQGSRNASSTVARALQALRQGLRYVNT
jgi:hypothetical protein